MKPPQNKLSHPDAVANQAIDSERAVAILRVRRTGAGLIPLNQGKVLLPWREERCHSAEGRARSAHHKQHRILQIASTDGHPLLDPVDVDEHAFIYRDHVTDILTRVRDTKWSMKLLDQLERRGMID